MSSTPDPIGRVLRHERAIVGGAAVLLVGLCWYSLANGAGMTGRMSMAAMAPPPLGALVLMWWLMMVAMMLPSAAPAVLLYARVRGQRRDDPRVGDPWLFALAYLLVWLLFSIAAALLQRLATGPDMALLDRRAEGIVLIAAGLYQLSPLKQRCLRECRSPAQFLSRHWRPGVMGALRLGLFHGGYCVGCCWLLMGLLFVVGIMNLGWIAALTLLVAGEKLLPAGGLWLARASGAALLLWGAARLFA